VVNKEPTITPDAWTAAEQVSTDLLEQSLYARGYMKGLATRGATSLSFDMLRRANIARIPQFKNRHGGPAHSEQDGSDWSPAQWLQAVVGELGEYANVRKKYERGDITLEEFSALASAELADVVTYLDILAFQLNIDLGAATVLKWNLVSERVGCMLRLTEQGTRLEELR
jgi:NTP pyrophosphatase (non-canonical NTP hydrolase)